MYSYGGGVCLSFVNNIEIVADLVLPILFLIWHSIISQNAGNVSSSPIIGNSIKACKSNKNTTSDVLPLSGEGRDLCQNLISS